MKQPIQIGNFTMQVSTCGSAWVAPGGEWIANYRHAKMIARRVALKAGGRQ